MESSLPFILAYAMRAALPSSGSCFIKTSDAAAPHIDQTRDLLPNSISKEAEYASDLNLILGIRHGGETGSHGVACSKH